MDHRTVGQHVNGSIGRHVWLAAVVGAVAALAAAAAVAGAGVATNGCPAKAPETVRSLASGAGQVLVPPGASSVALCRFRGLNDPNPSHVSQLVGSAEVTAGTQVNSLEDQFNSLPAPPSGTVRVCPADDGSSLLASFAYGNSPPDLVLIRPNGCASATNGYITGDMDYANGQRLRAELQRLTGCASSGENSWCDSDPLPLKDRTATVAGYIRLCGGPAPGHCFIEVFGSCAPACMRADRIAVTDSSGRVVARQKLRRARFRLLLAPGRYTIELLGDGKHIHGRVLQTRRVTARAHRRVDVVFFFAIP
jgi:hypothetical protein